MVEKSILVVGSLNMDQILQVPRLPLLGETLLGAGSLQLVPGGKGANQAVAMARLDAAVAMAGRVGSDPFGKELLEALHDDEVDTALIWLDRKNASGVACIFLTPDGDNAIVVAAGANMQMGQDHIHMDAIFEAIPQAKALVLQLEIPVETVVELVAAGHRAGIPVVLNLAPAQMLPQGTLQDIDVLIVNETEASLLSGQQVVTPEDARTAAGLLQQKGIAIVILTLGAQGAILVT
ncbi:MAG: ribokinase, partial [Chloroflexota bacterium]|nr:ribokinase [Chloroflexota bacterium]